MMTVGVSRAAAMCPGPVSLLITILAFLNMLTNSGNEVEPARLTIGTLHLLLIFSAMCFSSADPTQTMREAKFSEIFSARRANFSPGQHFSVRADPGTNIS